LMCRLARLPLLAHPLLTFQRCREVEEIVLLARKDRQPTYRALAGQLKISKLRAVLPGGAERQDSVWAGLAALSERSEIVLIHDAARALVTPEIIKRCVAAARRTGAAIPAVRVKDTIKRASPNSRKHGLHVETTMDRSLLWKAQTPQTFRTDIIRRAYDPVIKEGILVTDDAAAVERLGLPVTLVECDASNLKVTTPEDLVIAEAILAQRKRHT